MTTIPIDRQFYEWRDDVDGLSRSKYRVAMGLSNGLLGWPDLLTKRRVVILAEAGSGKTEELIEQARLQTAAGKFAFYATVQNVGHDGLDKAIRPSDRARLNAWRTSAEPGWFFIDSIDEAKLDNIRLEKAFRQIAEGITGGEGRAHIVLSGRHTDWEFTRDARRLNDELPLPAGHSAAPLPPLEILIRCVLRNEKRPEPPPAETPLIVVMAPLDSEQVRTYAAAKCASDLDGLMAAIEAGSLWGFARRPLDLNWIVRYWRSHGHLGSFSEMTEVGLRERLQETDPERGRRDNLDAERAKHGLERIGAALVFGRQATIAIPDNDTPLNTEGTVTKISDVLPDWSNEDQMKLLTRPAFDPATFGRARLHNDNEGVARAYLAARWLERLRNANLPQRRLHELLFVRTYGIELIKPSMLETAAWLALWDESVSREIVRRAPFLLFTAGDPASLPRETRQALLTALVERMRRNEELPLLDLSSLARFAQPDIGPALHAIWEADNEHCEIRCFVLRLIWLGKIKDCADVANAASFGKYQDTYTAITAGRALLSAGDERAHKNYAEYIKQQCASISPTVVWEALEDLFPQLIGVDDLLEILAVVRLGDREGGGFRLDWNSANFVDQLKSAADLTRLIDGLLQQLEAEPQAGIGERSQRDEQYAPVLGAAAQRLMHLSQPNVAPAAAIDAVLRICDQRLNTKRWQTDKFSNAVELLHRTMERRRTAFWRAADRLSSHRMLNGRPLLALNQMEFLGWPLGLVLDDIEWLLTDGLSRECITERKLAINAALGLWLREGGQDEALKARIAAVAATDADMQATYNELTTPRIMSDEEIKSEKELAEAMCESKTAQAEQEQSWTKFIADLRANPAELLQLHSTTATGIDHRIYGLWQLLRETTSNSCYAIDSVAPIAELAGEEVAAAFAAGLAKIWRSWNPTLHSARPPSERNQINLIDCLCITGVSIEAAACTDWALRLNEEQAIRAAEYATLEINGFPNWLTALVTAWPSAVEKVLAQEVASTLNDPTPGVYHPLLEATSRSDESLARLISPSLWLELQARPNLNRATLQPVLVILLRGLPEDTKQEFCTLALARFQSSTVPQISAQYLGAAYAINAHVATDALMAKLDKLGDAEKTALVERALPQIFGSRWSRSASPDVHLDVATLERLVLLAYRTVRIEKDHDRTNKGAYSPDERDEAQDARSAAFTALVNTPGGETYEAILRLIDTPDFPVAKSRLLALAYERAAKDSEHTAWTAGDALRFELQFEKPPVTCPELLQVALQRLEDMQHDLIHGDFQQGKTLRVLPDENAVQNWIADRLRREQGNAYSIEREPHVVEEKEPDLRLRAKVSDANVAIEIKVAESWSLSQLEGALVKQLCGQYLRAERGREGILLLVHQVSRDRGWKLPDGTYLSFKAVVQRLRVLAASIRGESSSGPQPEIAVIDVSSCTESEA